MINIINIICTHSILFVSFITLLGLLMGSFLNVIIYRLPLRMEQEWRNECIDCLQSAQAKSPLLAIGCSRSFCPHCKTQLRIRDNIPLLSYLGLRGKCAHCQQKISIQYPLVELISALLSGLLAAHFGCTWQTGAGLIFTWLLIAMSVIDFKHQLLPDMLTYIGIWLGLLCSVFQLRIDSHSAIIGGIIGYLSLWSIAKLFKLLTQKEGMGYGDFKLLAMLGTWLGWQMLPFIILGATLLGTLVGITLMLLKQSSRNTPIPFGPFLAIAGWLALMQGPNLLSYYYATWLI